MSNPKKSSSERHNLRVVSKWQRASGVALRCKKHVQMARTEAVPVATSEAKLEAIEILA
jgi:hypothetical protein